MNAPIKQRRPARRIFKGLAVLAILGVLGVAALLVSLWLEHRTDVTLPTPTGAFVVGHALYDWADDETLDKLAPGPGIKRELLVWIWYPAVAGPPAAIDDYLPAPLRAARNFSNNPNGRGSMSPPSQRGACALERCLKNRSTRTPSTAFPNSRSRTPPRSATGIRADARAYTPARDGGLRGKACSTASPGQPAKAEPSPSPPSYH